MKARNGKVVSNNAILRAAERCAYGDGEYAGWCTACGHKAYCVEPDAHEYECEQCGARAVYGAEELVMMGLTL